MYNTGFVKSIFDYLLTSVLLLPSPMPKYHLVMDLVSAVELFKIPFTDNNFEIQT